MELVNKGSYDFFSVSSEAWRTYEWLDGDKSTQLTICDPLYVSINPTNGGHRVLDAKGVSHYIQPGWKHLFWQAKAGQAHFVK